MKFISGDIIEEMQSGSYDAVAHGCNCMGIMGSGVAKVLNDYTGGELLKVDRMSPIGDINKLGEFTRLDTSPVPIYNLYTQFAPIQKGQKTVVHWPSVQESIWKMVIDLYAGINDHDPWYNAKILIPWIGCGLAGGNRDDLVRVLRITESMLYSVEFVVIDKK